MITEINLNETTGVYDGVNFRFNAIIGSGLLLEAINVYIADDVKNQSVDTFEIKNELQDLFCDLKQTDLAFEDNILSVCEAELCVGNCSIDIQITPEIVAGCSADVSIVTNDNRFSHEFGVSGDITPVARIDNIQIVYFERDGQKVKPHERQALINKFGKTCEYLIQQTIKNADIDDLIEAVA